jgi:probable rRNA maturation factor
MNKIEIAVEGQESPPWLDGAALYAEKVLEKLDKHNWNLSLFFCGNEQITALNKQYRNRDEPTDVLSFELCESDGERFLPGDIVISLEMLAENSRCFGIPPGEELRRLLIHGILHLAGMDHAANDKEEPMLQLQEKLLTEIPWNFPQELPPNANNKEYK